jgi:hypothetical protein
MAPREIALEVDDGDAVAADIEQAMAEGKAMVWVTDREGVKHGLAADKIAFIEVEPKDAKRGVGFATA